MTEPVGRRLPSAPRRVRQLSGAEVLELDSIIVSARTSRATDTSVVSRYYLVLAVWVVSDHGP